VQDFKAWLAVGNTPLPADPETPSQTQARLEASVQVHLDSVAQSHGYDSIFTAVTYADEPAVLKFQTEGQALRAWRSNVWATCYSIMADVQAGVRKVPTESELLAALPPAPIL
jgi:hypothetical protein